MKKLRLVGVWLFVLTAIGWGIGLAADEATDSGPATITLDQLGLVGTNMTSLGSLTDPQLEAFLNILNATPTISEPDLPKSGTFWSLGHYGEPPFPGDLSGSPAWQLEDGSFLLDDKTVKANVLTKGSRGTKGSKGEGEFVDAVSGPPSLSDTNSTGTNFEAADVSFLNYIPYGTNLYLAQGAVVNGYLTAIASNTAPGIQYTIESVTNLLSSENWQYEGTAFGSYETNWTEISVAQYYRTNLFIRLVSEISSDGSSLSSSWESTYFGTNTVDPNALDSAGDGYTIYQKYALGVAPGAWITPKTPEGFQATLKQATHVATITWLPSSGALTGYTLEKTDADTDPETVQEITLPSTATNYQDNLSGDTPDAANGNSYDVTYRIVANYTNGRSSTWSSPIPAQQITVSASITPGTNGTTYLAVSGVPANTTTIQLVYIDENAVQSYGDTSNDSTKSIPINSFTNGLYPLSAGWYPAPTDAYGDSDFAIYAESVDNNGNVSGPNLFDTEGGWQTEFNWGIPFYDGREQLKQNVMFQLRAAPVDGSFQFSYIAGLGFYSYPTNYAVASVYQYAESYASSPGAFDALLPFEENYLFRNFVFSMTNVNSDGDLTTGVAADNETLYYALTSPTFLFSSNKTPYQAWLPTNSTPWLLYDQLNDFDGLQAVGIVPVNDGSTISMASGFTNWFGLAYQTIGVVGLSASTGKLVNDVIAAGHSLTSSDFSNPNFIYIQPAFPQLQTAEYDFWCQINFPYSSDALPGDSSFTPTNQNHLLVTTVADMYFQIAGYVKAKVSNSTRTNVFGYIGQYFSAAYTMTNGVATATNTGILSAYGSFFATQPGPTALVTMPDPDTGARGTCTVYAVSLQVDANHDGTMDLTFNGPDTTSQVNPMVFWVNNGNDEPNTTIQGGLDFDSQVPPAPPNYAPSQFHPLGHISCKRDLENFARLWICGMPPRTNNYKVTVCWTSASNNPAINLYSSVETNGGTGYLTDTNIAAQQCLAYGSGASPYDVVFSGPAIPIANITPSSSFTFPANYFTNSNEYFLFEGAGIGSGELTMTITGPDNTNVIAQTGVWLDLHDIKDLYEGACITNCFTPAISNWYSSVESVRPATVNASGTDTNMIVWVHGINVPYWNWLDAGDTVFKRLYWAGYDGKFMAVKWPCLMGLQTVDFNASELRAYKASFALTNYLAQLRARFPGYRLNVLAHSQGNAVVSEAIQEGANIDTYILTEGAMGAGCYDSNYTNNPSLVSQESYVLTPQLQPMGYLGVYTNFSGRLVNYYNFYDPVLDIWTANQLELKPNEYAFNGGNYEYVGTNSYHVIEDGPTLLVTDPQESRAMVSRALTLPIGQSAPTTQHGVIQSGIDMHQSFGFYNAMPDDHSAQWTWPIQRALPYYQQVIQTIKPIQ